MVDNNCAYCMEGELVAKFGIKICDLKYFYLKSRVIQEDVSLHTRNMLVI